MGETGYTAGRTQGHRRRRRRRRTAIGGLAVIVLIAVGAVLLLRTPTTPARSSAGSHHRPSRPAGTGPSRTGATAAPSTPTTTVDPGSLPQTDVFPAASGPAFDARMAALWSGVVSGALAPAQPAFFPESAYVQLKGVADPGSDYTDRLFSEFSSDLLAAHALLGPDSPTASLVDVDVDESYGHWVPPGTCLNSVGYFEVPNARMVYSVNGQTRSFGIASMISWRGEWYVVHLGSVLRNGTGGQVDDPQPGPGAPTPSSTC